MKSEAALLVLLVVALSNAQRGSKGGSQDQVQCPNDCRCQTPRDHQNPQMFHGMANCTSMPTSLDQNILSLKVTAHLGTITKQMIEALGDNLRKLDLSNCHITRIEQGTFNAKQQLTSLVLSKNELTDLEEGVIACHALQELYLDGNRISKIDENAFQQLQNLKYLSLQQNKLDKLSVKLPTSLIKLDVSQNNIEKLDIDINKMQMVSLDLCGNRLEELPFKTSTKNIHLQNLCLAGDVIRVAQHIDTMFPSLKNLTLMASKSHGIQLDINMQRQIKKLTKLSSLAIVSFHIQDLQFLPDGLIELTLRNVTVDSPAQIHKDFQRFSYLKRLVLDQSPQLVFLLLRDAAHVSQLPKLHVISLRNASIVSIGEQNLPNSIMTIDIANNPLRCDCKLAWVVAKEDSARATCKAPIHLHGQTLVNALHSCHNSQEQGKLELQNFDTTGQGYFHGDDTDVEPDLGNHSLTYIVLGSVLLVLLLIGIVLAVVLSVMKKKRRKHQIVPEGGDTQMERTQQIKQSSSSDMLIKK